MGYTLGPIISLYVQAIPDGPFDRHDAFGITALAFPRALGLRDPSGRRFSFMGGFLTVGILTAFLLGLVCDLLLDADAVARRIRACSCC